MIDTVKHQETLSYEGLLKEQKMCHPEKLNRNGIDVFLYLSE